MSVVNTFKLDDEYRVLFFDIFYRDGSIYMILPVYNEPFKKEDIKLFVDDNELTLKTEILKDSYEPTHILQYICTRDNSSVDVTVVYKNISRVYSLKFEHIPHNKLTLTTMFKDDYNIFTIFYDYYKKQGVDKFYLYYNGLSSDAIKKLLERDDVILIDWNYRYDNKQPYKYYHHAQLGQIHHALYKYGKGRSEYMIFCDFDEYLYIPHMTISEFLHKTDMDFLGFKNRWATTVDTIVPSSFPSELMVSTTKYGYSPHTRSKTIYNPDIVKFIGIHAPSQQSFVIDRPIKCYHDFEMFHMYNLSNPRRVINESFKKISLVT